MSYQTQPRSTDKVKAWAYFDSNSLMLLLQRMLKKKKIEPLYVSNRRRLWFFFFFSFLISHFETCARHRYHTWLCFIVMIRLDLAWSGSCCFKNKCAFSTSQWLRLLSSRFRSSDEINHWLVVSVCEIYFKCVFKYVLEALSHLLRRDFHARVSAS